MYKNDELAQNKKGDFMKVEKRYKNTLKELRKLVKYNKNLSISEWDEYAHEKNLFSARVVTGKEKCKDWEDLKDNIKWYFFI